LPIRQARTRKRIEDTQLSTPLMMDTDNAAHPHARNAQ